MSEFKNKIILVTGASNGLGRAVAKSFIDVGADVIAVARNIAQLESLDDYARTKGNKITIVPLDLNQYNKIDELGYNIHQKFGKLDVMVSCAAQFGALSPIGHITPDVWDRVMNLNLTANWRLIRSMDPLLRAADNGRTIFVTSPVAKESSAYYGAYGVSKAALESLVKIYSNETLKTNVISSIISPPPIATDLRKQEFPGEDSSELTLPSQITDIFHRLASSKHLERGRVYSILD